MSIVVVVRVGDGLVMAADSASTLGATDPTGKPLGVAKVFNNATKLIQLRDYPIGVASWGAGTIGSRTISSLVQEFANGRPAVSVDKLAVETEARELQKFLLKAHEAVHGKYNGQGEGTAPLGVVLGGYSGTGFFPEEYVFSIPKGEFVPKRNQLLPQGGQDFGADWFGITDALIRFHHGRDDNLPRVLEQQGLTKDVIDRIMAAIMAQLQYPVPFEGMPLQDAVDYCLFMAGLAVGRFRFVIGPELCGGPIDVATITRDVGFRWVQRKNIAAGGRSSHLSSKESMR